MMMRAAVLWLTMVAGVHHCMGGPRVTGSVQHIIKCAANGWTDLTNKLLDPVRLSTLEDLQRQLIARGFALLAPGGVLVYSTCSFSRRQNEDVVAWLLEHNPRAAVLMPIAGSYPAQPGQSLTACLRFHPSLSRTSGLFIAKIMKGESSEQKITSLETQREVGCGH